MALQNPQTIGTIVVNGNTQTVSPNSTFGQAQNALAGRVIEFQGRFSF